MKERKWAEKGIEVGEANRQALTERQRDRERYTDRDSARWTDGKKLTNLVRDEKES